MAAVRLRAWLVALMLAIAVGTAGPRSARADDAQQARELFTQGNTFYDLGQFDRAIDAWQKGYQLKNDPGFLYNIAQAYRVMEDAQKAIFFYKRYLSNAPKAHNREEVEQKIDALQKQLSAQDQAKQLPPSGPFGPGNPVPPAAGAPADTNPPPATPVPASVGSEPPPASEPSGAGPVAVGAGAGGGAEPPPRRVDLAAAIGFDSWTSGVQGKADPSFAFTLAGGYTFGAPAATIRFRLGALLGYTFLQESNSKDSFTSFLIDPTAEFRLARRLRLDVDLGLGVLSIGGLNNMSALLQSTMVNVKGTQTFSEVRIGAGLQYQLTPALSVFVWPAIANSPQKQYFHAAISRVEWLAGLGFHL
jgi:tetratricopeptide (TPR) repeat protein